MKFLANRRFDFFQLFPLDFEFSANFAVFVIAQIKKTDEPFRIAVYAFQIVLDDFSSQSSVLSPFHIIFP